jgi:Zn-finger nucleic acid-binding protein
MRCPKCREILVNVERDGVRLRQCGGCYGCFLGEIALKRLTRLDFIREQKAQTDGQPAAARQDGPTLAELAELVAESATVEDLRCPSCAVVMRKNRVHPMIPVEVDTCPKCQSTWLDAGEMALISKLYYEMQTSDDPKIIQLREKIAGLNLQIVSEQMQQKENAERMQRAARTAYGPTGLAGELSALIRSLM